ncbi:MAG: hypothetical protein CO064_10305, partial [Anaerolineae bacterium CG_4_9_14_0_8_um_filter_58_9]
ELLPLWQEYNELTRSDTAAQAEIDAVVAQIQETMTPQQVQAITDMKLTQQDEFSLMQELGLVTSRPNASGTPQASSGQGIPARALFRVPVGVRVRGRAAIPAAGRVVGLAAIRERAAFLAVVKGSTRNRWRPRRQAAHNGQ